MVKKSVIIEDESLEIPSIPEEFIKYLKNAFINVIKHSPYFIG